MGGAGKEELTTAWGGQVQLPFLSRSLPSTDQQNPVLFLAACARSVFPSSHCGSSAKRELLGAGAQCSLWSCAYCPVKSASLQLGSSLRGAEEVILGTDGEGVVVGKTHGGTLCSRHSVSRAAPGAGGQAVRKCLSWRGREGSTLWEITPGSEPWTQTNHGASRVAGSDSGTGVLSEHPGETLAAQTPCSCTQNRAGFQEGIPTPWLSSL